MFKKRFSKAYWLLQTLPRLGFMNLIRVACFRLQKKLGYFRFFYPIQQPKQPIAVELIANHFISARTPNPLLLEKADHILLGKIDYFFTQRFTLPTSNRWFFDVFTQKALPKAQQKSHWTKLSSLPNHDIKIIWEPSRFYWMPTLARAYIYTQHVSYLEHLQVWFNDWIAQNPVNQGPHWLCAQEVAIRCLNAFITLVILNHPLKVSDTLWQFFWLHLQRISQTPHYAIGQQNNHASSEGACLYIVSDWLQTLDNGSKYQKRKLQKWHQQGRNLLEKTVATLVLIDGTFSQYSTNYQRFFLDCLSLSFWWQQKNDLANFSKKWLQNYEKTLQWLKAMVEPTTGQAPNLGHNDGGQIIAFSDCSFSDYRPSLTLAHSLLYGKHPYSEGPWEEPLTLLAIETQTNTSDFNFYQTQEFPIGGIVKLSHKKPMWAILRFPTYHFRPAQADCMHLDVWVGPYNLLRDSGTFSYNSQATANTSEIQAHNSITIDAHQPMPRLSHFLWGHWPNTCHLPPPKNNQAIHYWGGHYQHYHGGTHQREISIYDNRFEVIDVIGGIQKQASLNWHLGVGSWVCEGHRCYSEHLIIEVWLNDQPFPLKKTTCYYAPCYLQWLPSEKLTLYAQGPNATFKTIIYLKDPL